MLRFTKHALEKFEILKRHEFKIPRSAVVKTVSVPQLIDNSR